MTAIRVWLVLAVCLGLAAAPVAAATTTTIRVTSNSVSVASHDVAPKGASKGDTITYRDRLVNATAQFGKGKGARIGSDTGKLTFTSTHTATFTGTARLPGGTLTLAGTVYLDSRGNLVIPVTGGTGTYAHLQGTLTVGPGRDHVLNTYRLSTASAPVA